jgi:hypothetical protein
MSPWLSYGRIEPSYRGHFNICEQLRRAGNHRNFVMRAAGAEAAPELPDWADRLPRSLVFPLDKIKQLF